MMKKFYVLFLMIFALGLGKTFAQTGEITGKITDEKGEEVIGAVVQIVDASGKPTSIGTTTDIDGRYSIKPLNPGKYNISISYVGMQSVLRTGIAVKADGTQFVDQALEPSSSQTLKEFKVVAQATDPLITKGDPSVKDTKTAEEIKNLPTRSVNDIIGKTAGVFQPDAGKGFNIRGSRSNSGVTYVNGVKVIGNANVPTDAIEELTVMTGGVPVNYGDATGGVINIITKKPSSRFSGSATVQTSQGLDAFGYNLANMSLRGPVIKTKKATIMGFSAAFEYLGRKDADPSAIGVWQVKDDVLNDIKKNPLQLLDNGAGYYKKSENLTFKDLYKQDFKPNNSDQNFRGSLAFDISPAKNFNISIGGTANYRKYHSWVEQYTLLNAENNPLYKELNYRAFVRFTGSVAGKDAAKTSTKSNGVVVKNFNYVLQADFEKYKKGYEDETHGNRFFNYGYIGEFKSNRTPSFAQDTVTVNGVVYKGYLQNGWTDTSILFKPGTLNQYGTRFTEQYYQGLGGQQNADGYYEVYGDNRAGFTQNINQIQSGEALINGQRSKPVYNLWYNLGRQYNGYGIDNNNEQYRGMAQLSFDIQKQGGDLNRHSLMFGAEYEQRVERKFSVNPLNLWDIAFTRLNQQIQGVDKTNPTFRIGGVDYSANDPEIVHFGNGTGGSAGLDKDSMFFTNYVVDSAQSYFDKNLRNALGITNKGEYINLYSVSPDKLSLDLFSADELSNYFVGGDQIVKYRGYDHTGKVLTKQPTISDFFNAKNADGQFTRLQGAYKPIYASIYGRDKFFFTENLAFEVGLRVDYFNANQYVLKDPYSLYPIKSVGDVTDVNGSAVTHPDGIGKDYAVYVDNPISPNKIIGYRNGDQWYDVTGRLLASGKELENLSSTPFGPYLKDKNLEIKNPSGYDPSNSFQKYKAAWIFMPRLQFSFVISDNAQLFAHYDVLSQRPGGTNPGATNRGIMDLTQYLYWRENTAVKNNPNLRPERTIDFEFGYKQKLADFAAVTASVYYKEFRDMIQQKRYFYAYPSEYTTYANVDFGNTKGVNLMLDIRRVANFKVDFNYTLQFAEGTGSDDNSQQFLISGASGTNFRTVFPLDYDSRHMFKTILDFRFADSKSTNPRWKYNGPYIGKYAVLENFGINLNFTAFSGTPYTDQSSVTPEGYISGAGRSSPSGTVNGARKPWYFRADLRINKDFAINVGKKNAEASEDKIKTLYFQVFCLIENLFNTKNKLNVYRYTGSASDDGYLSSPNSVNDVQSQLNPQSYQDLYRAVVNSPTNYSLPRRIYLGASFNF